MSWWRGPKAPAVLVRTAEQMRTLQRRALRRAKHEAKHAEYRKNGLNGPRALARRRRKMGLSSDTYH
jgi:hypothetical protein